MARLNEPPVSTDNPEILRRKLLRQNRDLARANSSNMMKIRSLEAEKAQLISEKLELRGRIIELEKEAEDSEARRVADHALDIRATLEEQLYECISILGGLGQEPPRKKHASPRAVKASKNPAESRPRISPRRRMSETVRDAEIRALQEGRLPPIQENKPFPRRTMDGQEISALCSEAAEEADAADTTDSPELGPPPTSRFVDADADVGRQESPTKFRIRKIVPVEREAQPSPVKQRVPVLSGTKAQAQGSQETEETPGNVSLTDSRPALTVHKEDLPRARTKRKFGASDTTDQTTAITIAKQPTPANNVNQQALNRDRITSRTIKELANLRREGKQRTIPPNSPRKPLSVKSTNDDVSSPKKAITSEKNFPKPDKGPDQMPRKHAGRGRPKLSSNLSAQISVDPPKASEPIVDVVIPNAENALPETAAQASKNTSSPHRVTSPAPDATQCSTDAAPPGETSRHSRRARAVVSYAEPNLRDKMRRPTNGPIDAVTGEGRYRPRTSSAHFEEAAESLAGKDDANGSPGNPNSVSGLNGSETAQGDPTKGPEAKPASPRGEKGPRVSTNQRRKRGSVAFPDNATGELGASTNAPLSQRNSHDDSDDSQALDQSSPNQLSADPYDFSNSASIIAETDAQETKAKSSSTRRNSRSSRRLSSVGQDDLFSGTIDEPPVPKTDATRKRASLAQTRMEADHNSGDTSDQEVESGVAMRRRRSMML